tara:strand:- start:22 stop:243 length:222 start_codon:yes stop_codon:yes gene_type:complete
MKGVKEFFNSKSYAYTVDLCNNLEVNPALIDSFVDNLLVYKFDEHVSDKDHVLKIMAGYVKYRHLLLGGKKNG